MIALYLRLSLADGDLGNDGKDESNSIESQRAILWDYIHQRDDISGEVEEYIDDGYSGTNFNRPAFQTMLEDMKKGKIVTVHAYNSNGWAYIELDGSKGYAQISDMERVDTSIPESEPTKAPDVKDYINDESLSVEKRVYLFLTQELGLNTAAACGVRRPGGACRPRIRRPRPVTGLRSYLPGGATTSPSGARSRSDGGAWSGRRTADDTDARASPRSAAKPGFAGEVDWPRSPLSTRSTVSTTRRSG